MGAFSRWRAVLKGVFGIKAADDFVPVNRVGASLPRTRYPYRRDVREGLDSGVIMAPINWILRNFTEAELKMQRKSAGMWAPMETHPLVELVENPNPFYDGDLLWKATCVSYFLDGNAYWHKVRNTFGQVIQLWYIPHFLIEPIAPRGGAGYLSHFDYRPNGFGQPIELQPRDVIHFRFGLDPRNVRKGLSPLSPLLREVFTDDEAANFSASLLRNMGVPGGVVSPKDGSAPPSPEDVKELKEYMKSGFTGDKRGEWLVLGTPTEIKQFGFDPQSLMLGGMRDIAEERVCAALGIPAAVVGFGAGLQSTKVGAPQPCSARLWTPSGPTTMGEVEVGQVVAIPDGWGEVEAVYPQGVQDIYRITFQDGSTAESTIDHPWDVQLPEEKERRVMPLSEIANLSWWRLRRTTVPLQGVTEFAEQPTLIPPYVMGLLLADGSFRRNLFFSNVNPEIVERIKEEVAAGYDLKHHQGGDYRIVSRDHVRGKRAGGGTFMGELRRLGLWMLYSHEKFIPDLYKYNSSRVRRELLCGILDGDGYVNLHGQPALEQTSERLAGDVTDLVQSLGGYTLDSRKKANRSLRFIHGHPMRSRHDRIHQSIVIEDGRSLFGCSAKRDRCRRRKKLATRKFRSIELVRREAAQCISVDGGLYLTDSFLVTHNTMKELRRLAWTSCLQPTQRTLSRQLTKSLVPDVISQTARFRLRFDVSSVPAFAEEEHEHVKKVALQVTSALLRVDRAQEALGLEVDPTQAIYLRPTNVTAITPGVEPPPVTPAPTEPPGNGAEGTEGDEGDEGDEEKALLSRARSLFDSWQELAAKNGGG